MRNAIVSLAIGAGSMLAAGANATPLLVNPSMQSDTAVEHVRMVCDERGRCYHTRGSGRFIIERDYDDSYNYAPRGYVERRGYYSGGYYNDRPSVGIGVGPGGVGVGVGVGPRW